MAEETPQIEHQWRTTMVGEPREESVACAECGVYGSEAAMPCDALAIEYAYSKHGCNALLIRLPKVDACERFMCTRCNVEIAITDVELICVRTT